MLWDFMRELVAMMEQEVVRGWLGVETYALIFDFVSWKKNVQEIYGNE